MKFLYSQELNDQKIVIRYPKLGDEIEMCKYINTLSKEKTYIRFQGEKITLKSELEYLKEQLKRIKNKTSSMLLLFVNNKLSGITSIDLRDKIEFHVGVFGISISKEQRGKGLGKLLMKYILADAINNLKDLKVITLEVFAVNPNAKKMYESFGFKEFGLLPQGNFYKNDYVDSIFMYKKVK